MVTTSREIGLGPPSAASNRSRVLAAWAEAHYGLVSHRKLLALGWSRHEIRGAVRDGRLLPAGVGVYFVGHRSGVAGQREALALATAGPGAVLAGPSAAGWRAMTEPWQGPVHLIAPRSRSGRTAGVVRHADDLRVGEATLVRGLACVVPERAVLDLPPGRLRQALQWLMRHAIAVEPLVERMRGRRGAKAFRAEVAQLVPALAHTLSELEARFVRLCRRYGLPVPLVNGTLAGGDLLDCTWPGRRLVVELDGRRWHEHRDREDRARDRRRTLEGRLPVRYAWDDVTRGRAATAAEVRQLLALG